MKVKIRKWLSVEESHEETQTPKEKPSGWDLLIMGLVFGVATGLNSGPVHWGTLIGMIPITFVGVILGRIFHIKPTALWKGNWKLFIACVALFIMGTSIITRIAAFFDGLFGFS
ncbi:MAG: hypothetical protein FWF59_13355 [Turicibacter sp.]|nr:hypothetical protein [Turicibacter sp.]